MESPSTPHEMTATPMQPGSGRRSRAGLWWTLGIVGGILLLFGGCVAIGLLATMSPDAPLGGDSVAVIYIDGEIAGVGGDGFSSGGTVTPERVLSELDQAEDDDSVKAIVLRIDSPGGTASASEEIAKEVARLDKPVIASIGDVGASGAYMIAAQCDEIISTSASDIGSIGVIIQIGDYSGLMEKLGVKFISIHEGEFKDAGAPWRSLTATETAMLKEDIKLVYDEFIRSVARGRGMSEADVRELATGWAWPGMKAKELGLVDRIGNYNDAIDRAAALGKIDGEPEIVTYGDESFGTLLQEVLGVVDRLGPLTGSEGLKPSRPRIR